LWIAEEFGAALQADGEYEVTVVTGLKHEKEKRSIDHFAGLDVSVEETSVCILDDTKLLAPIPGQHYWSRELKAVARRRKVSLFCDAITWSFLASS